MGVGAWLGWGAQPVYYEYYVTDGYVYSGDEQVASVADYAAGATEIADSAAAPEADADWMPLGVFGVVRNKDDPIAVTVQLAVTKDGTIAGTYYNADGEITLALEGSVDKKTQRAAWKVGDEDAIVMETGLDSLTKDTSSVLMHFEGGVTESWTLLRMDKETAKEMEASLEAGSSRQALAASANQLFQELPDNWKSYLTLPGEVFAGGDPPSLASLDKALQHYNLVAERPEYRQLAETKAFQNTRMQLATYREELTR